MGIDRWHGRRPEGARGGSVARLAGYRRHFRGIGGAPPETQSPHPEADALVEEAMQSALAGVSKQDSTFGDYASLFGFFRSAVMQEGRLLEDSIARCVEGHATLKLLPTKPIPVVPAARELLKRTSPDDMKGIRLPARVHATESYKPDLFVMNRQKHSALILDVKRSLGSYRPQEIERLRERMLAAASIASEWLVENRGPVVVELEVAILDGADEVADHERGLFRLSEIDSLLETEGTAAFVRQVREGFSKRVQEELGRRCRSLAGPPTGVEFSAATLTSPAEVPDRLAEFGWDIRHPADAVPQRRFGYARRSGLH